MGAFDRWRVLTAAEQRLTMRSSAVLAAAVVGLRVYGVDRTLRIALRPIKDTTNTVIGDVVAAIDRAGRYVPGGTCLPKALALAWMLRGLGVAAAVHIGVKATGRFEAHAWVVCDGVAITEPSGVTDRFATILSR
jgi:transglutaminase-like putative cysteine protease